MQPNFQTRHYLEGVNMSANQDNMNKIEMNSTDAFKSASMNTNMSAAAKPAIQQMKQEQVQAISTFNEVKVEQAKPVEDVTFEIKGEEEMPVVMDNHFEGSATRKEGESLVQNSVNSTYGKVHNFMYNYFNTFNAKKSQIPVFMAMFMFASMTPFPAFAATKAAAVAPVVAQSGMTKLLKNVFCAGAAAVFTVTFIHPIDVVKTRM